jgi:hypothetical protein
VDAQIRPARLLEVGGQDRVRVRVGGVGRAREQGLGLAALGGAEPFEAKGEVAEDHGRRVGVGLLDLPEFGAHGVEAEEGAGSLERVLGLGQPSTRERAGESVLGGRTRGGRVGAARESGRGEKEPEGEDRGKAEPRPGQPAPHAPPHRPCRRVT